MKAHGLLQPVVVRPTEDGYSLLAGERRFRAAQLLGWPEIPARVRLAATDAEAISLMLTENLQRENLNPIEEAEAFARLKELGMTQAAIAKQVGRSQPRIAQSLRLRSLPEAVRERIAAGELSFAHGRAISRFADQPAVAVRIAELAVERQTGAKELEQGTPFQAELAAAGLVEPPAAEPGPVVWTLDECRAALARLPHRSMPRERLMALVLSALPEPPPVAASVWDAEGQEPAQEPDPEPFDDLLAQGFERIPAGMLAVLALLVFAAVMLLR